ncbi:MAG: metal-dependent hydrolase [Desulfuromonadales bacterium]|nr:metal-dependent hydrolase [Desulfuromonadales bacterium]MBN2793242.1 metal-dependent hydrolase [Desulfuromonadales bacterium]
MRWSNHQITTTMLVYAGTGSFTASGLSWAGSTFPDLIEFPFGSWSKHRTWSHWPYSYLLFLAGCWGAAWLSEDVLLHYLGFFFVGCLLHLAEDALSPGGIPLRLTSLSERSGLGWYLPFRQSEYLLALGAAGVAALFCWWRGFFLPEYLVFEVERTYLLFELFGWRFRLVS